MPFYQLCLAFVVSTGGLWKAVECLVHVDVQGESSCVVGGCKLLQRVADMVVLYAEGCGMSSAEMCSYAFI